MLMISSPPQHLFQTHDLILLTDVFPAFSFLLVLSQQSAHQVIPSLPLKSPFLTLSPLLLTITLFLLPFTAKFFQRLVNNHLVNSFILQSATIRILSPSFQRCGRLLVIQCFLIQQSLQCQVSIAVAIVDSYLLLEWITPSPGLLLFFDHSLSVFLRASTPQLFVYHHISLVHIPLPSKPQSPAQTLQSSLRLHQFSPHWSHFLPPPLHLSTCYKCSSQNYFYLKPSHSFLALLIMLLQLKCPQKQT